MEVNPEVIGTARDVFLRRYDGTAQHTETGEVIDFRSDEYEEIETSLQLGVYKHRKSTLDSPKLYYVGKVVRSMKTGDSLVLYTPLYLTNDEQVYARPYDMFTDSEVIDGKVTPRFQLY